MLKNLAGIRRKREMAERETLELLRAQETALFLYSSDHRFTAEDTLLLHRLWLRPIYEWAGTYRQVNISKGDFTFPPSIHLATLMADFERKTLARFTPCLFRDLREIICALAVVHTELVLIHPFREGNGRTARMLATLMALQAGLPVLDFRGLRGKQKKKYIVAVQAGMGYDYHPMEAIFKSIISRSLQTAASGVAR